VSRSRSGGVRLSRFEVVRLSDRDVRVPHYDAEDGVIHLEIFSPDQHHPDMYGVDLTEAVA
jgi:hypothetical protein